MILFLDRHSGVPVYRQIMDQILFQVASGVLAPGDELPSTRTLSAEHGLNPMTVSKAYSLLERDGVVDRHPGRPLRVRARGGEEIAAESREHLRDSLRPAAEVALQLGIEPQAALELFRILLQETQERSDG